jgi:hypothetical protein
VGDAVGFGDPEDDGEAKRFHHDMTTWTVGDAVGCGDPEEADEVERFHQEMATKSRMAATTPSTKVRAFIGRRSK